MMKFWTLHRVVVTCSSHIRMIKLQWVGQVLTMRAERAPKKALKGYTGWRRPAGRARRRMDATDRDAKSMLKCKNWRT